MKSVVIYKSKYGSAKQYAQWIAKSVGADIFDLKDFAVSDFEKYDTIIYTAGVYSGNIAGIALISKNFDEISEKNVIICPVCLTKPENTDRINEILARNFNYKMFDKVKVFPLRGALDFKKLTFTDKLMMKAVALTTSDKMNMNRDYVSEQNIKPVEEYIIGLENDSAL